LALRERAWFTKPSDGTSGSFASSRTQHGSAFVLERALDERDTLEMSAYSTMDTDLLEPMKKKTKKKKKEEKKDDEVTPPS